MDSQLTPDQMNQKAERLKTLLTLGMDVTGTTLTADYCAIALDYMLALENISYGHYLRNVAETWKDVGLRLYAVANLATCQSCREDGTEIGECSVCGRRGPKNSYGD